MHRQWYWSRQWQLMLYHTILVISVWLYTYSVHVFIYKVNTAYLYLKPSLILLGRSVLSRMYNIKNLSRCRQSYNIQWQKLHLPYLFHEYGDAFRGQWSMQLNASLCGKLLSLNHFHTLPIQNHSILFKYNVIARLVRRNDSFRGYTIDSNTWRDENSLYK